MSISRVFPLLLGMGDTYFGYERYSFAVSILIAIFVDSWKLVKGNKLLYFVLGIPLVPRRG